MKAKGAVFREIGTPLAIEDVDVAAVLPQTLHERLEELARARRAQGVDVIPGHQVHELMDVLAVDPQVSQQRRVDGRVVARLSNDELGDARVKRKLNTLQEQGVPDPPVRSVHDEDAFAEEELILLGLAGEPSPEVESERS